MSEQSTERLMLAILLSDAAPAVVNTCAAVLLLVRF
jgi:hypothetical protein